MKTPLNLAVALVVGLLVGAGAGLGLHPLLFRSDQEKAKEVLRAFYLPRHDVNARPDGELVALFRDHRPELDRLVKMVSEDLKPARGQAPPSSIYVEFLPWPEGVASSSGLYDDRAEEYRAILHSIGIRCALRAGRDEPEGDSLYISLVDSRVSWPDLHWECGLWYSETRPVADLFSVDSKKIKSRHSFELLEGNWYLFLQIVG